MGILKHKQSELLEFLKKYQEDYGEAPTLKTIGDAFGISVPAAQMRVRTLILKGYLSRTPNVNRSIVIKEEMEHKSVTLPVIGTISAGEGVEVFEEPDPELVEVPSNMVNTYSTHYCLQVRGNSMIQEGIMNGDYVVIRSQTTANNGDIVVAIIKDDQTELANLKKYWDKGAVIELHPRNPDYEIKRYRKDQIEIRGKFCGLFRK